MIQRFLLIIVLVTGITFTAMAKPVKVSFTYNTEDVTLIYNDLVYKGCPKNLKIDFDLGGQLIAFKPGYESQVIKISNDKAASSFQISLQPLENKLNAGLIQVELKKASFVNYVTNFTPEEVTDIINSKMNECNIATFSQNSVFKNANVNTKTYSIGAEVVKSTNKNGSYSSPYYLLAHQKIKWYVLENNSNNLLLETTTEGLYLAFLKASKGMVTSERLKEVTVFSLEEATQKFINSPEFINLFNRSN